MGEEEMNPVVNFLRRAWSWIKIRVLWLIDFCMGEDEFDKDIEGRQD